MSNYDVTIPAAAPPVDERSLAVRRRAAELSHRNPDRFFAVVREASRRELAGDEPIDALEAALSSVRTDRDAPYPPDPSS